MLFQNVDIVVFPEMTLTRGSRAVPVPMYGLLKTNPIPALNPNLYDEVSKTFRMYYWVLLDVYFKIFDKNWCQYHAISTALRFLNDINFVIS